MLELRELDLQLAFGALRAQREDVEDQRHAVDRRGTRAPLEIAFLRAGQRMVEDDEVGAVSRHSRAISSTLPEPAIERRIGALPAAGDDAAMSAPAERRAPSSSTRSAARLPLAEVELDQDGAIAALMAFKHLELVRQ
jgi:hypothetical protein